ncbi:hypothetical protein NHQ30_008026 [Ciborinia camelliae]|nr:hypothetical protein NHQ30_008026 [Ciborinia camelliae]
MTSSQTAETVMQPIAPVATMSTTTFASDNGPLGAHATVIQDNTESGVAEQDMSTTATMHTTLPSNSTQPMGPLPENRKLSPTRDQFEAAKEAERSELTSLPDYKMPSQPEEKLDSAMEISNPNTENGLNREEPMNDWPPEMNKHSREEPINQLIQKHSQSPPNKPLDSLPFCDTSNAPAGADQMSSGLSQETLQQQVPMNIGTAIGMGYPYHNSIHPQNSIAPNATLNNEWGQPLWDPEQAQVDSYAKLLFDDSHFYITTRELIIGRDNDAKDNMERYLKEQAQIDQAWQISHNSSGVGNSQAVNDFNLPPQTIVNISPSGGILQSWMTSQERRSRKERKHKNPMSANPSSQSGSGNGLNAGPDLPNGNMPIQTLNSHGCPIVRVHPPFHKGLAGFKSISREHAKIFYDAPLNVFKVEFLGRNGGFVDGKFYACGQIVQLTGGCKLQLGYVYVTFISPEYIIDETDFHYEGFEEEATTGTTTYSEGGKEMSLSFDDVPRAGDQRSTDNSECSSDCAENEFVGDEFSDNEVEMADGPTLLDSPNSLLQPEEVNDEDQDVEEEDRLVDSPTGNSPQPAKKRGPGRPPKNGIMSKREQQLAKKEAQERERIQEEEKAQEQKVEAQAQATASKTVPGKNKVGRPRKHPRPEVSEGELPRPKRKYTKRQTGPKEPEEVDEDKFDDDGNCIQAKRGSTSKVAYVLKEVTHKKEECTAEQLVKPTKNYLQLVFELLKEAGDPLCLPQIYNELEVKYPYFSFIDSKGWQSSVRHNLGQHECFERTKRSGKGWAWTLKEGTSYVKEKKKKAPSPPVAGGNQPIYQAGHPIPGGYPMQPPHGYMLNHQVYHPPQDYQQYPHGQPYMGPPNPHYAPYPGPQGYAPPQGIQPHFIPPMAPQLAPTAPASYSSPYAPKPPAATTQPQGAQQQPQQQQQQPPQQYPQQQYPQQPQYQPQGLPQPPNTSQSPVLPQQLQPSAGNQTQTPLLQAAPQAAPASIHQKRVIPPNLNAVVMGYRNHVVNLMRQKAPQSDAEALVDKAIKRVYDGSEEDRSLDSTEHEMKLINGVLNVLKLPLVPRPLPTNPGHTQQQQQQPPAPQQPPQPSANQNKPQGNTSQQPAKAIGQELPKQTIMRPSFYGNNQNQPSGSSVPRPPLMTPGLQRTNSGSNQIAPARPNTASSSSTPANPSNQPQASASSNNKTTPVANTVNQTIAHVVDQNGASNGLKAGETLTEAGFVRSFPQPQIST